MTLKFENHGEKDRVDQEFRHIDSVKEEKITFSTEAPTSKDMGRFWVRETTDDDTTITFYIRHTKTGEWRSRTFT